MRNRRRRCVMALFVRAIVHLLGAGKMSLAVTGCSGWVFDGRCLHKINVFAVLWRENLFALQDESGCIYPVGGEIGARGTQQRILLFWVTAKFVDRNISVKNGSLLHVSRGISSWERVRWLVYRSILQTNFICNEIMQYSQFFITKIHFSQYDQVWPVPTVTTYPAFHLVLFMYTKF